MVCFISQHIETPGVEIIDEKHVLVLENCLKLEDEKASTMENWHPFLTRSRVLDFFISAISK